MLHEWQQGVWQGMSVVMSVQDCEGQGRTCIRAGQGRAGQGRAGQGRAGQAEGTRYNSYLCLGNGLEVLDYVGDVVMGLRVDHMSVDDVDVRSGQRGIDDVFELRAWHVYIFQPACCTIS